MCPISLDPSATKLLDKRYVRESQNIDFRKTTQAALCFVGTGAIGPAVEQSVRIGVKHFHLFDNKPVRLKNLVAQNFIHGDIGLSKTEALRRRLEQCEFEKGNPDVPPLKIRTYGDFLAISDDNIEKMISSEKAQGRDMVMVMSSDYHPVQARGNRIALEFGIPVFWVGIYRMGMAGEIIFYVPGHDLPCYRCITETRYQFFEKNRMAAHLRGDSGGAAISAGLPMAATFVDAVLLHLIIGYIHREDEANPHGRLFRRLLKEKRNLVQCQLDPDYRLNDTEDIFAQIQGPDQICFNTIFLAEPTNKKCIDCQDPPNGRIWHNTDYTKEVSRERPESRRAPEASYSYRRRPLFTRPLMETHMDPDPDWEDVFPESLV